VFYREIAAALGTDEPHELEGDDPYVGERRVLHWPIEPLGARRGVVERAADAARAAHDEPRPRADDDVALLLAERAARQKVQAPAAPVRIAASRYKDFVSDYAGTIARLERPTPERPFRQTRLGTLFHSWVEQRSGRTGLGGSIDDALWESDDEIAGTDASTADAVALEDLRQRFLASEWAPLQPLEVETEIDFTATDLDGTPHVIICKLDAVYRRGDRIEIVDWKTGAAPRTAAERRERMLQLELYRQAYHAKHSVPIEQIDVVLYYVAEDVILRA